ncbi:putative HC-toxin efflux carrier TOXA [Neolecta irregularis DAH-3]|uniref:Putative HC-toxin efflux carrier TOXA n=1 Tax=Neolecta irregularis (strain DAH-3) TaxID=1198029 RepID=A0A1U7LTU1_NEOID|nr:putative HC-toxin efflux carrier TOXA [Neolecta irregularis DAH-3]|eukprot:OLL26095.1 putative HC-toxin efflux carrier TOXA [Neolecta irregularis DAH-3]
MIEIDSNSASHNFQSETETEKDNSRNVDRRQQDLRLVLSGKKLALAFTGLLLSILLVALDQTIVATALPVIASQFSALDQVTWIASAYFLTQSGFLLLYGKLLTIFDRKWVYLVAIMIFEIGSLFCGIAMNATFLIFGRAVAGIGAAGIFVSCITIISEITLLKDRPKLFGAFGAVFGASSVIGPLMGGAFTDHISWRWCFFINLPIGAITLTTVGMIIKRNPPEGVILSQKLRELDYIGAVLALGMITSLVLPLQWGGNLYPWNSKQVIISLCFVAVLIPVFAIWEKYGVGNERAILPMKFFSNRTVVAACIENFFIFFGLLLTVYYLPLQFQAVKGHSATQSGIDILPYMLSNVLAAGISGFVISATGHYWPFLIFGPLIVAIGAGLMYTFSYISTTAQLIGYQIIFGAGLGFVMQNTVFSLLSVILTSEMIAVQADVDHHDIPQASALCSFMQLVGGVLGIAVAGTIFSNELVSHLQRVAPDAPLVAIQQSVTVIRHLDPAMQEVVKKAYVRALDYVYLTGVPVGIIASICGLFIKRHNIKGKEMMTTGGA